MVSARKAAAQVFGKTSRLEVDTIVSAAAREDGVPENYYAEWRAMVDQEAGTMGQLDGELLKAPDAKP